VDPLLGRQTALQENAYGGVIEGAAAAAGLAAKKTDALSSEGRT
jgi:hypothetical protein